MIVFSIKDKAASLIDYSRTDVELETPSSSLSDIEFYVNAGGYDRIWKLSVSMKDYILLKLQDIEIQGISGIKSPFTENNLLRLSDLGLLPDTMFVDKSHE